MSFLAAHRFWFLLGGELGGYVLLMLTNPIRASLRDGFRCVRRYRKIWTILALFGFCYAAFQIALRLFYASVLPEPDHPAFVWNWKWSFPPPAAQLAEVHTFADWWLVLRADPRFLLLRDSALGALESVAGVFNNLITTFPFSALAALLLLGNWENHHATLRFALRRRFGRFGWVIYFGILICAVAAIIKPILFGPSLPVLNRIAPGLLIWRWALVIDWLSFLFQYLFGVCIQIYLILLVYVWVRGLNFTPAHLFDFAIRRFAFVVKWAAVVMLVSSLFIDLPRIFAMMFRFDDMVLVSQIFDYIDWIVRPLLALFLVLFATVQITLTFHSESLRKALRDHAAFLRRYWWEMGWFLLLAGLHFLLLNLLNQSVLRGFGEETATALTWSLVFPLLDALVAAWMLSTWVCLFKRCEMGRAQAEHWIRF